METCNDCPRKFPWLGDSEGTGIPGRDNYIFNAGNRAPNSANLDDDTQA